MAIDEKIVVVTGGASGIGEACGRALAQPAPTKFSSWRFW